jgi:hypothetical protein
VRRPAAAVLLSAAVLAGCGNDRQDPPDAATPAAPEGTVDARYPEAGVAFEAPGGWNVERGEDPLVATVQSGRATVAVWRYPRTEPLPRTREDLEAAAESLRAAVQARDGAFEFDYARVVRRPGIRGVEVKGSGRNQGAERAVRSLHVYAEGAEIVVDAYAPPKDFERVDEAVFVPLTRSLRVSAPRG